MIKVICTISIILLIASCKPYETLLFPKEQKKITHKYSKLSIHPVKQSNSFQNFNITINPIDPHALDSISSIMASYNGVFENEQTLEKNYFLEIKNDDSRESERYANLFNAVDFFFSKENLSPFDTYIFKKRILLGSSYGLDGSELTIQKINNEYSSISNPYFIDNKYLSTFEFIYSNNSESTKKIKLDNISILIDNTYLSPISSNTFNIYINSDVNKFCNLIRLNHPDSIAIPTNKTIRTFLAIPPIHSYGDTLDIYIHNGFENFKQTFITEIQTKEQEITYDKYYIKSITNDRNIEISGSYFFVKQGQKHYPIKSNYFYLDKSSNYESIEVIAIATARRSTSVLKAYKVFPKSKIESSGNSNILVVEVN